MVLDLIHFILETVFVRKLSSVLKNLKGFLIYMKFDKQFYSIESVMLHKSEELEEF